MSLLERSTERTRKTQCMIECTIECTIVCFKVEDNMFDLKKIYNRKQREINRNKQAPG